MRTAVDLARELTKVSDTVKVAAAQLRYQAQSDALLHMSSTVRPNPLTVAMEAASDDLIRLIAELTEEQA